MTDNIFQSLDNQNRSDLLLNNEKNFPGRSVFPYGRSCNLTMNEGYIYPVDSFFVVPSDSVDIDLACYLEVLNPFVDRQFSGMRLTFHVFYGKCEHQWRGWKAYSTRGHRGNISLTLPTYSPSHSPYLLINGENVACDSPFGIAQVSFDKQGSLCSYLNGIARVHLSNGPVNYDPSNVLGSNAKMYSHNFGPNTQVNRPWRVVGEPTVALVGTSVTANFRFNALKYVFYQRCFRDFYLNKNLTKDNKNWWPDDDDDWILPYSATQVVDVYKQPNAGSAFSIAPNNNNSYPTLAQLSGTQVTGAADTPCLGALRCRQWQGDIFTTSVPFLERNGTTELFNLIKAISYAPDNSGALRFEGVHQPNDFGTQQPINTYTPPSINAGLNTSLTGSDWSINNLFVQDSNNVGFAAFYSMVSLNQLAELSAATLWSRRNARSQGDYNSLIQAHYGINPDSEDKRPTYLGGSTIRLTFDDVVSNTGFDGTAVDLPIQPLGSLVSRASAGGRIKIPHFEVKDFGYIMVLASLVPDTFYTQGQEVEDDPTVTGADLPWPEFANLDKEPLLLRRLFYNGDDVYDNRLIGYNERFLAYKYRMNRLLGHMLDYQDLKFKSMSFARYFTQSDAWSFGSIDNEFVTMTPYSVRSDMYTVPSQPHFILQFGDGVRLVRPLPYVAKDSVLTNIA